MFTSAGTPVRHKLNVTIMLTRRDFAALMAAGWGSAAGRPEHVQLDFSRTGTQLDGPDGASVCQFHGSDPENNTISAVRSYGTLGGYPNDGDTDFGRFCDTAFSTRGSHGMGLSQIWSTPCGFQSPQGSLGRDYDVESWRRLDFSMYLDGILPAERHPTKHGEPLRGHTVAMLLAALRRARRENQRILFWNDLHTDYPMWMWKDRLRRNPIPEEHWDAAALHLVYYAKYLIAVHGIPVHAISIQNEPDLPSRHQFTPEMLLRLSALARRKLDQAGLPGVRIIPFTSVTLNTAPVPWLNRPIDTLARTTELLRGRLSDHAEYVDYLGGHMSHGEAPFSERPRNVRFWRASGDFDNHHADWRSVTFDMGKPDQIDEVIRLNTWLYGKDVSLAGIWQVALRMGHTVDQFRLPEKFNLARDYRPEAVSGAATVNPWVRPGMFVLGGSLGRGPREPFSVDAYGGRGHREAIVISNSGSAREFLISCRNAPQMTAVDVYQATPEAGKRQLASLPVRDGSVRITVPAESVTTLVAQRASSRPRLVLVTGSAERLTRVEEKLAAGLGRWFDVGVVSSVLTRAEQERERTRRHPVDAMGAAAFVLAPGIGSGAASAHRAVMAPVAAIGAENAAALGVRSGQTVEPGASLNLRDSLDPPAEMLQGGVPKACGWRFGADKPPGISELHERLTEAGGLG